jgi:methylenetetrahydrofolate reductase (NADPH)
LRIDQIYARSQPAISLELFPPKTDEAEETLFRDVVPQLRKLNPSFFSVTYGAGGGTRERTLRMVSRLRRDFDIEAMPHLTCVGATREMIGSVLDQARTLGIENILALRGDPPKGETEFKPVEGGFSYAIDLIKYTSERGQFAIGAAFYPEGHIESGDKRKDWDRAADKVRAGANFLISQLFYDVDDFWACTEYLKTKHDLRVPMIPGVLPFLSTEQIKRFTSLCGAKIPEPMRQRLEKYGSDDNSVRQYGVEVCIDLCRKLLAGGVPGIHIYCLNRLASAAEILANLATT